MPISVFHQHTITIPDSTQTAIVRPSNWNSAHNVSVSLASNEVVKSFAAGTSTITSGQLSFANSNGVSFGLSNGTLTASHNGIDAATADATYSPRMGLDPSGFPNGAYSTSLSWSNATRTLTITPLYGAFDVWSLGTRFVKFAPESIQITNASGLHFIYYDASGVLQETDTLAPLATGVAGVVAVYWDADSGAAAPDAIDARGDATWPSTLRVAGLSTTGCVYEDGLGVAVFIGGGTQSQDVQVALDAGHIWNTDLRTTVAAKAQGENLAKVYRSGVNSDWKLAPASSFLVTTTGTGRAAYNYFNGSSWSLAEAPEDSYVVVHVFAAAGITNQWFAVLPDEYHVTLEEASLAASVAPDLGILPGGFDPSLNFKMVAAIVVRTSSAFSNSVKSRVEALSDGSLFVDWRRTPQNVASESGGSGGGIAIVADGSTFSTGAVPFANSNGISFKTTAGSIVGSYTVPSDYVSANQSSLFQQTSNTSAITSNAAVSNHSHGNPVLALTNLSGTTASNSNGLTLSLSVAPGGGGADGYNIMAAAGSTANTATTILWSNSNGVSFGLNGGTMTASVVTNATTNNIATSNSSLFQHTSATSAITSNAMNTTERGNYFATAGNTFANSTHSHGAVAGTNISATSASSGLSLSVAPQSQQPMYYSAANGSTSANTLTLANSNGVSFSTGTQGVYATVRTDYQSAGAYLTTARASNDAVGLNTALTGNGVLWTVNSSGVSLSVPAYLTTARGSTDAIGLNSALTANGVSMTANSSGLSLNFPAFLTTAAQSGHSHGNPTLNLTNLSGTTASNSAGLTLSLSGPGTVAQTNQTIGVYGSSNTTGQSSSSTVDARSLTIVGAGVASVGMSGGSVVVSVPIGGGGDGYNILAANGSTAAQSATIGLINSNGVSWGLNGTQVTATVKTDYLTTAAQSNHSHGNPTLALTNLSGTTASNSAGLTLSLSAAAGGGGADGYNILAAGGSTAAQSTTIAFSNSNGVSFGLNGGTMTASVATNYQSQGAYLTTARASNDAIGLNSAFTGNGALATINSSGLSLNLNGLLSTARASNDGIGLNTALTGNGVAWTVNSSGLSLSVPAFLTTAAQSNHSHGNPTLALTNISGTTASNSAGLTLSLSAGAGAGGGYSAGVSTGGNTAGATGITGSNMVFVGTGPISLSQTTGANGGTISIAGPDVSYLSAGAGISLSTNGSTVSIINNAAAGGVAVQAGTATQTSGTVIFSNSNGVSFGMNAGTVTASVAGGGIAVNAGTQTQTSGTLVFANSNGITFGMSNSSQITASIASDLFLDGVAANGSTIAGGFAVLSNANGVSWGINGSTITASAAIGTAASALATLESWGPQFLASSTVNQQIGNGQIWVVPAQANMYATATRADHHINMSISSSSNSSHAGNISFWVGVYTRNVSTLSLASSGSTYHQWTNTSNNSMGSISSHRRLTAPINMNITPGDYWVAMFTRTSTTNANWFTASNAVMSLGMSNQLMGVIGQASNNTHQLRPGMGLYSATTNAMPASIAFSQISGAGATASASKLPPVIHFFNFTA